MSKAPLAGIRVVEVCDIISGPLTCLLLRELGADVVKVETPSAYYRRNVLARSGIHPLFFNTNRGKRSLWLDAKHDAGRAVLQQLVGWADVFVTNLRPGKPDALGVGPQEAVARNPRLIYVSITGFGPDGPYAELPVWDFVIQGLLGMVDYQRDPLSGQVDVNRQIVVDKATAQTACQATLAALFERERSGLGQHVEVSMLEAGLQFFWTDAMAATHSLLDGPRMPLDVKDAYRVYPTLDGLVVTMPTVAPFERMALALDHPEWLVDRRFNTPEELVRHIPEALALYGEGFATMTTAEAMRRCAAEDVPLGRVGTRDEMLADPQIRWAGSVIEHEVEGVGRARQPHPPWRFSRSSAEITASVPHLGAHTREVLLDLGLDDAEIERLAAASVVGWP